MMEQNNELQQEKRNARRRRRQRNQIIAYIIVIVLLVVVAAGVVLGVKVLTEESAKQSQNQQNEQNQQTQTGEVLPTEGEQQEQPSETQETVTELTPEQKLDEIVEAGIAVMPLEDKVAGLFFVTPEAITGVNAAVQAGEGTQNALAQYAVGGLVYFEKNIQSEEQLKQMIDNTYLYSQYPLFIGVDEEGGSVSRVADAGIGEKTDTAQAIGQTGDAQNAYQAGSKIGATLSNLGFNLNFAPVADLNNIENSAIKDRSYGSDAAAVSSFVTSMMQGLEEQNVIACLKHFPGVGSSVQDTHDGIAVSERSAEEFRANEFAVFQAGINAGADMIMVGHIAVPSLTGDNTPSSLSSVVVTDILRNELNFDGIVITDALNMSAISGTYTSDKAAVLALQAGCDMLLMPQDFEAAYNGVLQAVADGTLSEERINESLRRIYRVKYADKIEDLATSSQE